MKACMLAYTFYENDSRVRKYAESLVKIGYNVDVVVLKSIGQNDHENLDGINIFRIQKRSYKEKKKFSYLLGVLLFLIRSALVVTTKHLKEPYSIIHVHSVPDFEVFATLIPKILGAKIILDIHDPVPDFFAAKFGYEEGNIYVKLLKMIEFISALYADHVITVTAYWKEKIRERSILRPQKISVILNVPDKNIFHNKGLTKQNKTEEEFKVIYPGTLNKHCGLDIVIRAISILTDKIPTIKLYIYGEGSESDNLKELAKELGVGKNVQFRGSVSLNSVPELMFNSDVGIALLSGNNEYSRHALNVKLFEFLAMGLPAIATRTESIEYYLGEDVVLLSKPNDFMDVAKCIETLYVNSDKRTQLKNAGLEFIKDFQWENEMKVYFKIIERLNILKRIPLIPSSSQRTGVHQKDNS